MCFKGFTVFLIRRIYDSVLPVNQAAVKDVRRIFEAQFPDAPVSDIEHLADRLQNPFKKRFRTVLYVAENSRHSVTGFAIVLHEPVLKFCYLDFLAAGKDVPGRGVGAALYEFVRDEAVSLAANGLFYECLPDDPDRCQDPKIRKLNAARLRFYETYGACPIVGTKYHLPVPDGTADNVPDLVWDCLDKKPVLPAKAAQEVVRAILERKYSDLCPPAYVKDVVQSFNDPIDNSSVESTPH